MFGGVEYRAEEDKNPIDLSAQSNEARASEGLDQNSGRRLSQLGDTGFPPLSRSKGSPHGGKHVPYKATKTCPHSRFLADLQQHCNPHRSTEPDLARYIEHPNLLCRQAYIGRATNHGHCRRLRLLRASLYCRDHSSTPIHTAMPGLDEEFSVQSHKVSCQANIESASCLETPFAAWPLCDRALFSARSMWYC